MAECTRSSYFHNHCVCFLAQTPRSTDCHSQLLLVRGLLLRHEAAVLEFWTGTPWGGSKAQPASHPGLRGLTWEGLAEHRLSCTWLLRISKTKRVECVWGFSSVLQSGSHNTLMGAPAPSGSVSKTQRTRQSLALGSYTVWLSLLGSRWLKVTFLSAVPGPCQSGFPKTRACLHSHPPPRGRGKGRTASPTP